MLRNYRKRKFKDEEEYDEGFDNYTQTRLQRVLVYINKTLLLKNRMSDRTHRSKSF